jgi:hypothetical protein
VKCTQEGNNELLRLTFDRSHIHLICTVHCLSGNTNIEIKGTLFLIPEEEIIENKHWSGHKTNNGNEEKNHYYNLLPFNIPHINLPDLLSFVSTVHNFLTLIGILTIFMLIICFCVRFNIAFQLYKLISHKILFVLIVLVCLPPESTESDESSAQQNFSKFKFKGEVNASIGRDNADIYGLVPLINYHSLIGKFHWNIMGYLFDWKSIGKLIGYFEEYYLAILIGFFVWKSLQHAVEEGHETALDLQPGTKEGPQMTPCHRRLTDMMKLVPKEWRDGHTHTGRTLDKIAHCLNNFGEGDKRSKRFG